jgi:predicted CXXCH cytochrome family protein
MPRLLLIGLIVAIPGVLALGPEAAFAIDAHLDPNVVSIGCPACHRGHGVSRSPMLPGTQTEVCLSCHDSQAKTDRLIGDGTLDKEARPQLLSAALSQPFTHPMDDKAFSRRDGDAVVCTSCHSPHRGSVVAENNAQAPGERRFSTRDPSRFEFELCQQCHGNAGATTQSLLDLSRLTNPNNRSYHPVEAPAVDRTPSVSNELAGKEINCSECHGNSDQSGPRGPHGSAVRYLLRAAYTTVDGSNESEETYALCYDCHDRDTVLDGPAFPLHRNHVVDLQASCATCHSAHGSVENRALIRFGEETYVAGVGPSARTGRIAFESVSPGFGACYVTCHGVDHDPETYGGAFGVTDRLEAVGLAPLATPSAPDAPVSRPGGRQRKRLKQRQP